MIAAGNGKKNIVRFLLTQPDEASHLNDTNNNGCSALHFAAQEGDLDTFTELYNQPTIHRSYQTVSGTTTLMITAIYNQVHVMKFLLEQQDTDITTVDNDGNTALHWAAMRGSLGAMKLLVDHPIVNKAATNKNGETSLDVAVRKGHNDIVNIFRGEENQSAVGGNSPRGGKNGDELELQSPIPVTKSSRPVRSLSLPGPSSSKAMVPARSLGKSMLDSDLLDEFEGDTDKQTTASKKRPRPQSPDTVSDSGTHAKTRRHRTAEKRFTESTMAAAKAEATTGATATAMGGSEGLVSLQGGSTNTIERMASEGMVVTVQRDVRTVVSVGVQVPPSEGRSTKDIYLQICKSSHFEGDFRIAWGTVVFLGWSHEFHHWVQC